MRTHGQAEEQRQEARREMDRLAPQTPNDAALDERLRWQAQERAERLHFLRQPLLELARGLSMLNPDWDIAEQIHLRHVTLEIAACPEAEPIVVESQRAEGWEWRGRRGFELTISGRSDWSVKAPELLESTSEYAAENPFLVMNVVVLMDVVVEEVQRDVLTQVFLLSPIAAI